MSHRELPSSNKYYLYSISVDSEAIKLRKKKTCLNSKVHLRGCRQSEGPLCTPHLYPHEEYVITGESRPDRWLCVNPQCSPGRVILPRGHYQINSRLFFYVWASPKCPTGLLLPLSLYAILLLSVFVFSLGLSDMPGYMPLSSGVQATKPKDENSRREVSKCKFTANGKLYKLALQNPKWYGMPCLEFFSG